MADYRNINAQRGVATGRSAAEIDEGLRTYMLRIYNYMALAVGLTGVTALMTANYAMSNPAFAQMLYASPLKWVVMLSPFAFVLVLSFGIHKLKTSTAQMIFWAFAATMGVSLSSIFLVYTGGSIAQTFFVTAASFASLSLYGYTTKRSLSAMGSFLMMGLFGIIIASVVNMFLASSAMAFAINVIGVLVFAGLVAYDTQRIKNMYDQVSHDSELMARATIMGALSLYLDFVNLFLFLLSFMGNRN
jgi:FtsH-binding integral membrane protein